MHILILGPVTPSDLVEHLDHVPSAELGRNHGAPVGALCRGLLNEGHELTVVTHERGRSSLRLSGQRVTFLRVASRSSPRRQILDFFAQERREMVRLARMVNADVVHAHWTYEWHRSAIGLGVPLVVTIHDAPWVIFRHNLGPYWVLRALNSLVNRILTPRSTAFVAVSEYVKLRWTREHHWRRPVEVIPNVVNVGTQLPQQTDEDRYIIELADSSRRKRTPLLKKKYLTSGLDWPLELIGAGLTPEAFGTDAPSELDGGRIRARGNLPRAEALARLAGAAVHVHASAEESFGMTVIESLILGVPVVVDKNSGGPIENLRKYHTGVAIDFKRASPQEFRDSIREAANQHGRLSTMVNEIRREHSESTIAQRYLSIYRRVMHAATDTQAPEGV